MKTTTTITLSSLLVLLAGLTAAHAQMNEELDGIGWYGTYGSGAIPTTMTTPRMFWYPKKAAFRAGVASTSALAEDSKIGNYSTALGQDSVAQGANSVAMTGGVATGTNSISLLYALAEAANSFAALGGETDGGGSVAMGWYSYTAGESSIALGVGTWAHGYRSVSIGADNRSWGSNSVAIGSGNNAGGTDSVAMGYASASTAKFSVALGRGAATAAYGSVALGSYNVYDNTQSMTTWVPTSELLVVGNGTAPTTQSNALVMTKDAKTRIGGDVQVKGIVRCAPGGDLAMGDFDEGDNPEDLNAALKYDGE